MQHCRARSSFRSASLAAAVAAVCGVVGPAQSAFASGLQLKNLSDIPSTPRFTLPADRVWSTTVGAPAVALWDGDRFASMSLTIDDNHAEDISFWRAQQDRTGLKFTWFIVTDHITATTGSVGGTWAQWNDVRAAGNNVQSHTVTHFSGSLTFEQEYAGSISAIEANMPGNKVRTLAYPGGTTMSSDPNKRPTALNYFQAGRGTVGTPNKANLINYMETNSAGAGATPDYVNSVLYGTSGISWLNTTQFMRSFLSTHYHGVSAADEPIIASNLDYIASKQADLWFGLFEDVTRYGQERDTSSITVTENSLAQVRFILSDDMDDALFNYPLTVKMRVDDSWGAISATQGGISIPVTMQSHNGANYALVYAVPDAGEVVVSPVPEPASLGILGGAALGLLRRRRTAR